MDYYTLYIFNGYTLCKFTLSYTDYTYNILYNITTSEYITSIIRITSIHVSIRLLCIVKYTSLCRSCTVYVEVIKCINIQLYIEVIHYV